MTNSRQISLLKALGYFWMTPFCICMVITTIVVAKLPDDEIVEAGWPLILGIWLVLWLVVTFLCTLGALPVFLHKQIAEQFQQRLCLIAGLGGVVTCGLLYTGAWAMQPDTPSFQWVWVTLGVSIVTMEILLGVCFGMGWLRAPARDGFCQNCGYDLRASPLRCPECGKEVSKHVDVTADAAPAATAALD
jgi:hypothetical protein